MHDDERLRQELCLLPVPDHGRDYRKRREAVLAAAAPLTQEQAHPLTAPGERRRRPISRRMLIIAAAAAVCLAAVVLGVVFSTARNSGGTEAGSAPSLSQAGPGRTLTGDAPHVVGDDLTGMVRGLDGEIWAWGYRQPRSSPGKPVLERWDGQSWQAVPTPAGEIAGVAALSSADLWIAENTRRGGQLTHWDGATWTAFPAISFARTTETSNALLALSPSDIWAVGWAESSGAGTLKRSRLTTLHWDGRSWSSVPAPAFGRGIGKVSLRLIRGVSPDAVWALGDYRRYRRTTASGKGNWVPVGSAQFLLFWDGRRWTRQPWPTSQLSSGAKDGIAINDLAVTSDGELWCAGSRWFGLHNTSDLWVPIVLRLQAGRWQVMASSATPSLPADWKQFISNSISLTSSQDVWVAGGIRTDSSLWHWDGSAWSVVTLGRAQSTNWLFTRSVFAVAANDVWVLTERATASDTRIQLEPFFVHFDGVAWRRVPAAPSAGAQR